MILVDNRNRLKMVQGDSGSLRVEVPGYKLKSGDKLYLTVSSEEIGAYYGTGGALFTKTTTSFNPDGTGIIKIEPRDTKSASGRHYYDIQVTRKEGDIHTVIPRNIFEIIPEVTTNE